MGDDYSVNFYGDIKTSCVLERSDKVFNKIQNIDESLIGKDVLIRARIHNSRVKGNLAFLVLRDHFYTIQCVASKNE